MKTRIWRWIVIALLVAVSSSCAVSGGGYGYNGNYGTSMDIGVGYYEPFGGSYGGWGPGYNVGPFRGGDHRSDSFNMHRGRSLQRAFRPAPSSHSMPSIPSRGANRNGGHPSR